jgi:hypothetical protein
VNRKRWINFAVACIVLAGVAIGTYQWITYDRMPPVRDVDSAMRFMSTDDFNRYNERQRLKYAMDTIDKMRQMPYDDLLGQLGRHDEQRTRMMNNLRKVPGHERFGAEMFALFLDRFWDQNPGKRTATLMMIAMIQQGEFGKHPERYGLPSADQIKHEMNKFVTRQPVKTQAQCAQFMVELKRQREFMGLKDPF